MLIPKKTSQFKKDIKRLKKSGQYDIDELEKIMTKLTDEISLDEANKEHYLSGNYFGFLECHIKSDWLLIYKIDDRFIMFSRTGTHSQLFK